MKNAIIFLNGDLSRVSNIKKYIDKDSFIICANGGTKFALELKLVPNVIIGDFDSFPPAFKQKLVKNKITWITHPKNKDQTDSELAINYGVKYGFKKIIVTGILGRRLDHMIANLFILASSKSKNVELTAVEGNEELHFVKDKLKLKTKNGRIISLIPLFKDCLGVSTRGLEYELKNETLHFATGRGVSNVAASETVSISVKKGIILLIHQIS